MFLANNLDKIVDFTFCIRINIHDISKEKNDDVFADYSVGISSMRVWAASSIDINLFGSI